jgi:UDP-3-O-[3-hydroxymyristoyl] glucosamine N-acyltransferase
MLAEGVELSRQDPESFINQFDSSAKYINLVINNTEQRKHISQILDDRNLERFSYIHKSATVNGIVESGCFIYPNTVVYSNTCVECDTIIHSLCVIAHHVTVGRGSFFSAGVLVGGTATLGKFNKYMLGAVIHDKITVCDNVTIGTKTVIRKNITVPGVYSSVTGPLKKLKIYVRN